MAENLTDYYSGLGIRVRYLHSDIHTLERVGIIPRSAPGRIRRAGGREPPARGARYSRSVAGGDSGTRTRKDFCARSGRSFKRAGAPRATFPEKSSVRRQDHAVHPGLSGRKRTAAAPCSTNTTRTQHHAGADNKKSFSNVLGSIYEADYVHDSGGRQSRNAAAREEDLLPVQKLKAEMKQAAKDLAFEKAAALRDEIKELNKILIEMG
jgi:excinuclease ABC subunit B